MPAPAQHRNNRPSAPHGQGAGHRREDDRPSAPSFISAPYNFVPLSDRVFLPPWGQQVSHDIPFHDGISGELHYTLTAETPLLVGGRQTKPGNGKPGEVKPFRLPDGTYAIPGSSLKGLLRSVVEIAAFGRMSKVDDRRLSVRDLTRGAREFYGDLMSEKKSNAFAPKTGAGWLTFDEEKWKIIPCDVARVEHDELEKYTGDTWWNSVPGESDLQKDDPDSTVEKDGPVSTVALKYRKLGNKPRTVKFDVGEPAAHSHSKDKHGNPKKLYYRKASNLGRGKESGVFVFTGQPTKRERGKGGRKHMEFIFFNEGKTPMQTDDAVFRDFLNIHAESAPWAFLRKQKKIPVFYLTDQTGSVSSIGLAMMYRLAYAFSTHDMIGHTSPAHLQEPGAEHGYDLADLLFGAINSASQADALRGRVSCDMALAAGKPEAQEHPATILNGPKPSYFPNYITQPADPRNWTLKPGQSYATYISTSSSRAPTLRGFKRYPVRPVRDAKVQALTSEQEANTKVQVVLHTLPPQTSFQGRIVFHNLKPAELGALLWALTWGGKPELRHSLGMGKPFGFGQVRFELQDDRCRLIPNDPAQPETPLTPAWSERLLREFSGEMNAAIQGWENTPQMLNLLAMANPQSAAKLPEGMALRHMRLESDNEFQSAKQASLVLADYAVATGALDANDFRPLPGKPCLSPLQAAPANASNVSAAAPAQPSAAPIQEKTLQWDAVTLSWNKGNKTLTARAQKQASAPVAEVAAKALMDMLPAQQRAKLEKLGELKGAQATVTVKGNAFTLKSLAWPTSN